MFELRSYSLGGLTWLLLPRQSLPREAAQEVRKGTADSGLDSGSVWELGRVPGLRASYSPEGGGKRQRSLFRVPQCAARHRCAWENLFSLSMLWVSLSVLPN